MGYSAEILDMMADMTPMDEPNELMRKTMTENEDEIDRFETQYRVLWYKSTKLRVELTNERKKVQALTQEIEQLKKEPVQPSIFLPDPLPACSVEEGGAGQAALGAVMAKTLDVVMKMQDFKANGTANNWDEKLGKIKDADLSLLEGMGTKVQALTQEIAQLKKEKTTESKRLSKQMIALTEIEWCKEELTPSAATKAAMEELMAKMQQDGEETRKNIAQLDAETKKKIAQFDAQCGSARKKAKTEDAKADTSPRVTTPGTPG